MDAEKFVKELYADTFSDESSGREFVRLFNLKDLVTILNKYKDKLNEKPVDDSIDSDYMYKDKIKEVVFDAIEFVTADARIQIDTNASMSIFGFDELDFIEFIMEVEKGLKVVIPDNRMADVEHKLLKMTVGEMITWIYNEVK